MVLFFFTGQLNALQSIEYQFFKKKTTNTYWLKKNKKPIENRPLIQPGKTGDAHATARAITLMEAVQTHSNAENAHCSANTLSASNGPTKTTSQSPYCVID